MLIEDNFMINNQQQLNNSINDKDTYIKELKKENSILFEQLNIVQEELEKYYYKLKKHEQNKGNFNDGLLIEIIPKLNETIIENIKLNSIVKQQKLALTIEKNNSLAARLGDILIKSVSSTHAFLTLPIKLLRIWRSLEQTCPPSILGGNKFQKIIESYELGGLDAVEKLLNSVFVTSVMRANAYTALARHLMSTDIRQSAKLAYLAWETDPRSYRLKWLAFRMHEAGDYLNAEAIVSMLPHNINITEPEKRYIQRIYEDSKYEREQTAQKIIEDLRNKATQQYDELTKKVRLTEEQNKNLEEINKDLYKKYEKAKNEINKINTKINEQQKILEKSMLGIEYNNKNDILQQDIIELQINKSNVFILQIASILKTILMEFDKKPDILMKLIPIIIGLNKK